MLIICVADPDLTGFNPGPGIYSLSQLNTDIGNQTTLIFDSNSEPDPDPFRFNLRIRIFIIVGA